MGEWGFCPTVSSDTIPTSLTHPHGWKGSGSIWSTFPTQDPTYDQDVCICWAGMGVTGQGGSLVLLLEQKVATVCDQEVYAYYQQCPSQGSLSLGSTFKGGSASGEQKQEGRRHQPSSETPERIQGAQVLVSLGEIRAKHPGSQLQ